MSRKLKQLAAQGKFRFIVDPVEMASHCTQLQAIQYGLPLRSEEANLQTMAHLVRELQRSPFSTPHRSTWIESGGLFVKGYTDRSARVSYLEVYAHLGSTDDWSKLPIEKDFDWSI